MSEMTAEEEKVRQNSSSSLPPHQPDLLRRQSSSLAAAAARVSIHPPMLSSYQSTPITKHYDLNNQILSAFELHYESKLYRVAYAIGLRFVETALLEIPKHGYFYSERHRDELMVNSLEAIRVTNLLQEIQQQDPDLVSQEVEQVRLQKLQHLALEQASVQQQEQQHPHSEEKHPGDSTSHKAVLVERSTMYEKQRAAVEKELSGLVPASSAAPLHSSNKYAQYRPGDPLSASQELDKFIQPILSCGDSMAAVMCPQRLSTKFSDEDYIIIDDTNKQLLSQPPTSKRPSSTTTSSSAVIVLAEPAEEEKIQPPGRHSTGGAIDFDSTAFQVNKKDFPNYNEAAMVDSNRSAPETVLRRASSAQETTGKGTMIVAPSNNNNMTNHEAAYTGIGPGNFSREQSMDSVAFGSFNEQLQKALYLSGLEVEKNAAAAAAAAAAHNAMNASGLEDEDDQYRPMKPPRAPSRNLQQPQVHGNYYMGDPPILMPEEDLYGSQSAKRQVSSVELAIQTIKGIYHEDFDAYRDMGHIRVSHIDTYQGKIEGSTNGCTVIAPLLCIHHFMNTVDFVQDNNNSRSSSCLLDPGLPDATIIQVMEEETPAILPKIRNDLGLIPNAFLIPSDAHDYLIESQLLSQEQFVTVCGGNILNEDHLSAFVNTLRETNQQEQDDGTSAAAEEETETVHRSSSASQSQQQQQQPESERSSQSAQSQSSSSQHSSNRQSEQKYKKLAATLFFHEHVIAILKLQRSPGCYWYDIIDSLPSASTLRRKSEEEQFQKEQQEKQRQQEMLFQQQQEQYNQQIQQQQQQQLQQQQESWDAVTTSTTTPSSSSGKPASNGDNSDQQQQDLMSSEGVTAAVASNELIAATSSEALAMAAAAEAQAIADEERATQFLMMNTVTADEETAPITTARIRCLDETALTAALRWYACSKFDRQNLNYIDMYPWDENNCDFDPRVFQAFVWTEA